MEERFKEILAQYCPLSAGEIENGMRFREDLGLSSLDFATLLGELEDELDLDFEDAESVQLAQLNTVGEALAFLEAQA